MIKIQNNLGLIGLKSTQMRIRTQIDEPMLRVRQSLPKVETELEGARVNLDSARCWEEIGLKDTYTFSQANAQKGYEACFSYTGQTAEQGDMMARPDKYELGTILGEYAGRAFDKFDNNVTRIPSSPVDVSVIPARTKTDWQLGEVKGEYKGGKVTVKAMGGKLEVYLRQQPYIDIRYEPQVDLYG